MATNLKQKRKKLYFDLLFNGNVTNSVVLCTQLTASSPTSERYGGLLDALVSAQGATLPATKAKMAVSAWFQPNSRILSNATSPAGGPFLVDFVSPKVGGTNITASRLPYLTVGLGNPQGTATISYLAGHEAIYSITVGQVRHFSVRVRRGANAGVSVSGTLYVQRQNTLEV